MLNQLESIMSLYLRLEKEIFQFKVRGVDDAIKKAFY